MLDKALINAALLNIEEHYARSHAPITQFSMAREYITLKLATRVNEVFGVIFLDTKHCPIAMEELFTGTIDGAAVYPRVVVQRALFHNAAAVLLYHNHPSGNPEPSAADQAITNRLKEALSLVEVRVLDHIVVGGATITSFAERGLL